MNRILICGGTGFVGASIAKALAIKGETVRVLTRNPDRIRPEKKISGVEYVAGNILDLASLDKAIQNCQTVINAAQFDNAPFENPSKGLTYEKIDGDGTENIAQVCKQQEVARLVYISGAGVAEGKTEPWFHAKFRAEKAVRNSGAKWTIFRPSWIYGPGDRTMNRLVKMIRWFPVIPVFGKNYRIQPIFIEDIAAIVTKSLHLSETFGQVYELGGPQQLTMKEIHQTIAFIMKKRRYFPSIPKPVAAFAFRILEKVPWLKVRRDALDFITMDVRISENEIEKVKKTFQIKPQSLEKSLPTYI